MKGKYKAISLKEMVSEAEDFEVLIRNYCDQQKINKRISGPVISWFKRAIKLLLRDYIPDEKKRLSEESKGKILFFIEEVVRGKREKFYLEKSPDGEIVEVLTGQQFKLT